MKNIIKTLESQLVKLQKEADKHYTIYLKYKSSREQYFLASNAYEFFENIEKSISKLKDAISSIESVCN